MDILLIFFIGICFGSFMNVIIYRLPREKSIVTPPSSCPKCNNRLKFYDNIPILSYLILCGKCRYCKTRISIQYPVVEFITGIAIAFTYYKFGYSFLFLKYATFIFLLLAAALTDYFTAIDEENFECGIIPDEITIGGVTIGLIFSFALSYKMLPHLYQYVTNSSFDFNKVINIISTPPVYHIFGVLAGFLILWLPAFIFQLVTKKEGMGGGDIKLFMMIGAFLGWKPLFFILFISSLMGTVIGIPLIIFKRDKEYMIPYGPFIALAAVLYVFYGDKIINKYMQMIH